jgi:hypothetical protein
VSTIESVAALARFSCRLMPFFILLTMGCTTYPESNAPAGFYSPHLKRKHETVEDWRGSSDICAVHHVQMRTEKVPNAIDKIAEESMFPNAGITYNPVRYRGKRGMIYVCSRCQAELKNWVNAEPAVGAP